MVKNHKIHGFKPWLGKIPWRRKWQSTERRHLPRGEVYCFKKKNKKLFLQLHVLFFFFLICFLNVDHFLGVFTEVVTILLCFMFDFF